MVSYRLRVRVAVPKYEPREAAVPACRPAAGTRASELSEVMDLVEYFADQGRAAGSAHL